jgi:hypothetical protein
VRPRLAQAGMFSHWEDEGDDGRVGVVPVEGADGEVAVEGAAGEGAAAPRQQSKVTPSVVLQQSANQT